jgi:prefoldin subunit 5
MNAARRKAIATLTDQLDQLKSDISNLHQAVEDLRSEEQDYFDSMPESLQNGDRGQKASEAADQLQTACDGLDAAGESLQEALEAMGQSVEG